MTTKQLTDIPGIGAAAAKILTDAGFDTADDVAKASTTALSAVKGFGPARAARVIEAAKSLVNELPAAETAVEKTAASGAPSEPQPPVAEKELESAKEKESAAPEKPAAETKPAAQMKPVAQSKPTAQAELVGQAKPIAAGAKPATRPAAPKQPSMAKGAAVRRLVREPWYLVGLIIAVMVGAGFAQQSGLLDTFGLAEAVGLTDDKSEAVAETEPAADNAPATTGAPQTGAQTAIADAAPAETQDETTVAETPGAGSIQRMHPETAVPAVYRPFAHPRGPVADWPQGPAIGDNGGAFAGRPVPYGYGVPHPYFMAPPPMAPFPVPGPYHAFPGIGAY